MVDITGKINTLRTAIAEAILKVGSPNTIDLIKNDQIPKGNVFEMSKAAGLLGIKKTPELLPDCHPLPVESASIQYEFEEQSIRILVTVKTIYKTGVEVEAMTGAGIVALNMYDMLKPVDKQVEIGTIRLLQKEGGKSSRNKIDENLYAAIIDCSNANTKESEAENSAKLLSEKLSEFAIKCELHSISSADERKLVATLEKLTDDDSLNLIICTGGIGVGQNDITNNVVLRLLDTELKGVSEQINRYRQERMPYSMLSGSVAGLKNGKIVLTLSDSVEEATNGINACFPYILNVFDIIQGKSI